MMFNIVNGKTPDYLNDITRVIYHCYNNRSKSSNNVFKNFCHKKSLKHCDTSFWNNLPSHVKSFKKSLILMLLKQNQSVNHIYKYVGSSSFLLVILWFS